MGLNRAKLCVEDVGTGADGRCQGILRARDYRKRKRRERESRTTPADQVTLLRTGLLLLSHVFELASDIADDRRKGCGG